jgi:hypothetical protein
MGCLESGVSCARNNGYNNRGTCLLCGTFLDVISRTISKCSARRLKLGGGQAYGRSSDETAVIGKLPEVET